MNEMRCALSIYLVAAVFLAACKTRNDGSQSDIAAAPASVEKQIGDRLKFYDSKRVYWLYIDKWGKDPAKGWNSGWNRIQTGLIPKDSVVPGAKLTLSQVQPEDSAFCDSPRSQSAMISTEDFQLSAMGNKTRFASKGNLLVHITDPAQQIGGIEYLHLVGLVNDVTYMREGMAYDLIREAGSPASAWTWVKLCVDNIYYGLYFVHERSDDLYYKRHFDTESPTFFYEGAWEGASAPPADMAWRGEDPSLYADKGYEQKGPSTSESFKDLVVFLKVLNGVGEAANFFETPDYVTKLEKVFDADRFIRWAAAARLLGAWDNYMQNANNYFLGNFGQAGTRSPAEKAAKPYFRFIPVDFDNVYGQRYIVPNEGVVDIDWANASLFNWNSDARPAGTLRPMIMNLLRNPKYNALYRATLKSLLAGGFSEEAVRSRRDSLWQVIEKGVFAEADSEQCSPSKPSPFQCAHTGRSFSNHSVWRWTHLEDDGQGGRDFIYNYGGGAAMRAEGLVSYTKRRSASALLELTK